MTVTCHISFETPYAATFNIADFVQKAARLKGLRCAHFDITFIADEHMSRLHQDYFNDPSLTDIITFNLESQHSPHGDLYICVDDARRHAREDGRCLDSEIQTLLLHGLLHCVGYVDHNETARSLMFQEQDRLHALVLKAL